MIYALVYTAGWVVCWVYVGRLVVADDPPRDNIEYALAALIAGCIAFGWPLVFVWQFVSGWFKRMTAPPDSKP